MDFLSSLEQSGLATWVREGGSIWSYPTILFAHTLGLATLAGVSGGLDLRVLGFGTAVPLAPLRRAFPLMWTAFGVTALSGVLLLIADATTKMASPVFYIKMIFVGLALATLHLLKVRVFAVPDIDNKPLPAGARGLAIASLLLWVAATTAGRLMAYIGPVSGLE